MWLVKTVGDFLSNPTIAWSLVFLATVGETVWFVLLKKWGAVWPWNVLQYALVITVITMLTFALKSLPSGSVYAFWTGTSAIAIALLGIFFYGDPATPWRLVFIAIAVVGVIGIQLTSSG